MLRAAIIQLWYFFKQSIPKLNTVPPLPNGWAKRMPCISEYIKECGILSHPGADTPLEIPLDQPDSSKKLKWLVLSTWPDML